MDGYSRSLPSTRPPGRPRRGRRVATGAAAPSRGAVRRRRRPPRPVGASVLAGSGMAANDVK
ncbi:hypothetical protein J8J27_32465, partial [Mycobacterium tuberculosis]|nr:hypothetical protein [Mycobacterium tuberculosis]